MSSSEFEYVGFWFRVGASLIDTVLLLVITIPLLLSIYGAEYWTSDALIHGPADFLISWVLPAIAVITFWIYRQATPGKMAIGAKIVDASSGNAPSAGQLVGRYFAYFVSTVPLLLGLVWVAFDGKKQGWHDKLANTVVIRVKKIGPQKVEFSGT